MSSELKNTREKIMKQNDGTVSKEARLNMYICWGIIIGSIVGLFAGIFWFEMGLSLLFCTALGLIIGSAIGSLLDRKSKSIGSKIN